MSLVEKSEGVDVPMTNIHQNFKLWPGKECKHYQSMFVLFERSLDDDDEVKIQVVQTGCKVILDTSRLNSWTYGFNVRDTVDGIKTIEVFVNKSSYGRAQLHVLSKMEQLEHLLHDVTDASKLLCQSMNCETAEDLDLELLDLLSNYSIADLNSVFSAFNWNKFGVTESKSELPTLLHFGAKFGLLNFCHHLLRLPGGQQAMKMKNKDNLLPDEIARENGFDALALNLRTQYVGGCEDKVVCRRLAEKSEKGSSSRSGKEEQDRSAHESVDSGIQMSLRRSGRSSASCGTRENSGSSSRSGSSIEGGRVHPNRMTVLLDED